LAAPKRLHDTAEIDQIEIVGVGFLGRKVQADRIRHADAVADRVRGPTPIRAEAFKTRF
jgi:hypothetical protein